MYTYFILILGINITVPAICKADAIEAIKQQTGINDRSKFYCLGINLEK
jgi:hypothetical protein